MLYDTFVCAGGGFKGISAIGALHYLYKHGLARFTNFYGTSVGTIISYLLALDLKPKELIVYIVDQYPTHIFFSEIRDLNILERGVIKYETVNQMLRFFSIKKLGYVPTLKQLWARHGKFLSCTVYNYSKGREETFDPRTQPNMSCLDAIQASCSLIGVFEKFMYKGDWYMDGGYCNIFPLDKACMLNNAVFGIHFNTETKRTEQDNFFQVYQNIYLDQRRDRENSLIQRHRHCCTLIYISTDISQCIPSLKHILQSYYLGFIMCQKELYKHNITQRRTI